ncbi:7157_t:CDS:2 [Dentiscutata heterogama]|uniref:7157_t:CDS:1 n=1 Tax=Dentiscutata heterogama TaxID=1316150 RepID=A0ACA9NZY7_9GLOM|nr:7157_t:CDS:2 [Dentiscutata heterogama]
MADTRYLLVLKLMAPALAKFLPYMGQEPPNNYLNKNTNTGDFDNAVKCNILKSMMGRKYVSIPANNNLVVGNLAINSLDTL